MQTMVEGLGTRQVLSDLLPLGPFLPPALLGARLRENSVTWKGGSTSQSGRPGKALWAALQEGPEDWGVWGDVRSQAARQGLGGPSVRQGDNSPGVNDGQVWGGPLSPPPPPPPPPGLGCSHTQSSPSCGSPPLPFPQGRDCGPLACPLPFVPWPLTCLGPTCSFLPRTSRTLSSRTSSYISSC